MKTKRIILFLIFSLGMVATDFLVGQYAEWRVNRSGITIFSKARMRDFYAQPKDIQLLFLGSSHSYRSFDPRTFEGALKVKSFNLGSSGQNPTTSYYLLKEALRIGHPLKTLIIETYWEALSGQDQDFDSAAEVFYYMNWSSNKIEFFGKSLPFPESLKALSKTFQYRNLLADPRIHFGFTPESEGYKYEALGFVSKDGIATQSILEKNPLRNKKIEINAYRYAFLEKTIELAKTNNIRTILVTTPLPPTVMKEVLGYSEFVERMKKLAEEHQIDYIDYNLINRDTSLFLDKHFADFNHLNNEGVEIISAEFLRRLR